MSGRHDGSLPCHAGDDAKPARTRRAAVPARRPGFRVIAIGHGEVKLRVVLTMKGRTDAHQ
ncbi:hypothetical protein LA66_18060 [Aureimonas altamirensis]|uniref:Uncharacterized protein n=1 Tax=Aureimonas altamirensis TaxID=370622 RepID=A0A0B1Q325_9HYPH|nr:hypothetical protein LA66_18060 [Aureimonas altamirensis]